MTLLMIVGNYKACSRGGLHWHDVQTKFCKYWSNGSKSEYGDMHAHTHACAHTHI